MPPTRKTPSLYQVELDWAELRALGLKPGDHYVLALSLVREPGARELESITERLGDLVRQLRRDRIKARCVVLMPGQRLQVFHLDEAKRAKGRRRDDDDEDTRGAPSADQ